MLNYSFSLSPAVSSNCNRAESNPLYNVTSASYCFKFKVMSGRLVLYILLLLRCLKSADREAEMRFSSLMTFFLQSVVCRTLVGCRMTEQRSSSADSILSRRQFHDLQKERKKEGKGIPTVHPSVHKFTMIVGLGDRFLVCTRTYVRTSIRGDRVISTDRLSRQTQHQPNLDLLR